MEQEVNIQEVLKHLRDQIGMLSQENAILKAQLAQTSKE